MHFKSSGTTKTETLRSTAESNFDGDNANDVSHTCERLDAYSIEPTDDYVKDSVKAVVSEAVKRRQHLFMVTGVKITCGVVDSISSLRRVGGGARAGFGGESLGVPFDGGPQFTISGDIYDEETYGESSDFVFAYRVRQIVYPKRGWESIQAGSGIVNYGRCKRTRERLLPLDRALGLSTRGSSFLNATRLRYQVLCWSVTHRHGKKYARARARAVCKTEELNTKW
ncbi:hypothetical protein LZL87_010101 [Fusarium oxysporum]|nr:hypothetical protein LZL87_010101 [Fusarium oxysporum]